MLLVHHEHAPAASPPPLSLPIGIYSFSFIISLQIRWRYVVLAASSTWRCRSDIDPPSSSVFSNIDTTEPPSSRPFTTNSDYNMSLDSMYLDQE